LADHICRGGNAERWLVFEVGKKDDGKDFLWGSKKELGTDLPRRGNGG